jgi:hypothetical protein
LVPLPPQKAHRLAKPAPREEGPAILDEGGGGGCADAWAAACYCADADAAAGGGACGAEDARAPVFSPELGLAVEPPRDAGTTLHALWSVL